MDNMLWLALSQVRGIGIKKLMKLNLIPDLKSKLDSAEVRNAVGKSLFACLNEPGFLERQMDEAEQNIYSYKKKGIEIIPYTARTYPDFLRVIPDPPVAIYCRGNTGCLGILRKVAIVGTRWPLKAGWEKAKEIAAAFSKKEYVIVSGLAEGIDTAAHTGALEAGGITIAVLPGSIDNIYPQKNIRLAKKIVENNGLLISEYPIGTEMQKRHFVERDRLQSGLSLGVCVVQTEESGGAMHTANFCRLQKKLLFCASLPECIGHRRHSGVEKLIDEGALVLENTPEGYKKIEKAMLGVCSESAG